MDDHAHYDPPHNAWPMEEAISAGLESARDARRRMMRSLRRSETFKAAARRTDELLAHWRWRGRTLQDNVRVPVPVEWDSRHVVALLELGRVLHEYLQGDGVSELPPVTVALMLAQTVPFLMQNGVLLRDVSLSPYCVVELKEYSRLLTAAFVHVDATHLIANLTAALPEMLYIETNSGSTALACDLALLTLLTHGLYVGAAFLQKSYFVKRQTYYSVGAVGFSGVVFALKVWVGYRRSGRTSVWGIAVPSQFSWVITLAFTHVCVPEASFPVHMCGVLAGILRAYVIEPVLHWRRPAAPPNVLHEPDSSNIQWVNGEGQVQPIMPRRRPRRPTYVVLRDLGIQLTLAATATAMYFLMTRRRPSTLYSHMPSTWGRRFA